VVLVLVLAGGATATYFVLYPPAPSVEEVQNRFNAGDASGDGAPYRLVLEVETGFVGTIKATATIDPTEGEAVIGFVGQSEHSKGNLKTITNDGETQLLRDYQSEDPTPGDEIEFVSRDGRTYTGVDQDGNPITLTLDRKNQFASLAFSSTEGFELFGTYEYDNVRLPSFKSDAPRATTDIPLPPDFSQEPGHRITTDLGGMSEAVQASELEIRFIEAGGTVVEATGFENSLDQDGYFFQWTDSDNDGFVNDADRYDVEFPSAASHIKIFDEWAGAYVGDIERVSTPSGSFIVSLGAIALGIAMWGRRPRD
jgi:hypothetical protein